MKTFQKESGYRITEEYKGHHLIGETAVPYESFVLRRYNTSTLGKNSIFTKNIRQAGEIEISGQEFKQLSEFYSGAYKMRLALEFLLSQLAPQGFEKVQNILYSDCLHPSDDDKNVVDLIKEALQ